MKPEYLEQKNPLKRQNFSLDKSFCYAIIKALQIEVFFLKTNIEAIQ